MGDPMAIARRVVALLRDPESGRRLGAEAQRRYQRSYRPEVMATALEDLFADLIGQRRTAHA
jgi:glycosyltransferase involved in cell wall biosynthesis